MLEKIINLAYNLIMKKLCILLGIFLLLSGTVFAEETTSTSGKNTTITNEINSSFSQIKPKKKFFSKNKSKDTNQKQTPKSANTQNKETVTTTKPAEKVIKEEEKAAIKEKKRLEKQAAEQKQYQELQELTQQYQQAVALYNDNNLDESLAVFSKIPEDKRPAQAWLLMGNIMADKEKKDEAAFLYGRAIVTEPNFYKAYYNLGNLYLEDDKYNMAIDQYKRAERYNPNNEYVYYNLGCAYLKIGELKKAKSAFIRAIELNNKIADFHYNLAYVYKRLKKEKLAKTYLNNYNKLTGEID